MATGDKYLNLIEKRLVGHEQFRDYFLDALRKDFHDTTRWTYNSAGTFTTIGLAASGADEFDLNGFGTTIAAIDGAGNFLNPSKRSADVQNINFENLNSQDYDVAIQKAEIPNGLFINPVDGLPQFDTWEEVIGWQAEPDSVTDNGDGTLTFEVDSITESSVTNAGRKIVVWKKQPGKKAVILASAVETLAVSFLSSHNVATSSGDFGQDGNASTSASDYYVTLLGPRVSKNTQLHTPQPDDWCFIGTVTGGGSGNPPSAFDTNDQTQLNIPITDFSQATRYATNGRLKIDVQALSSESGEDQIRVTRLSDGIKFRVDELGNTELANLKLTGEVESDLIPNIDDSYDLGLISKKWSSGYFGVLDFESANLHSSAPKIDVEHSDGTAGAKKWKIDFSVDEQFVFSSLNDGGSSSETPIKITRSTGDYKIEQFLIQTDVLRVENPSGLGEIQIHSPANDPDEAIAYWSIEDDSRIDFGIIDSANFKELSMRIDGTNLLLPGKMRIGGIVAPASDDALTVQGGNLSPHATGSQNLGRSFSRWGTLYIDKINLSTVYGMVSDLLPDSDGAYDFGSFTKRWKDVFSKYLIAIDSVEPQIRLRDSGAGTNDGNWAWSAHDDKLYLYQQNDDWSVANTPLEFSRGSGFLASAAFTVSKLQINASFFEPGTSGVLDIGGSSHRWKDAWLSGNLYATGQARVGSVRVDDDPGSGVADTITITKTTETSLSTGAGGVKLKGTTARDNAGFIKLWVGATAVWVPYWSNIS